jgi:hypothetical protein
MVGKQSCFSKTGRPRGLFGFFRLVDSRLTARPRFAQLSQHNGNKQEAKIEI